MPTYRITYRSEVFIEAKDEEELDKKWEDMDLSTVYAYHDAKFVELLTKEKIE